jgi:hypothetical protein
MLMAKRAISVTIGSDNLTWLKARAGALGVRSMSALLDRLITDARARGSAGSTTSVVGTIDLDASDPLLLRADEGVRALFEASLGRPLVGNVGNVGNIAKVEKVARVARERSPHYQVARRGRRRRG